MGHQPKSQNKLYPFKMDTAKIWSPSPLWCNRIFLKLSVCVRVKSRNSVRYGVITEVTSNCKSGAYIYSVV